MASASLPFQSARALQRGRRLHKGWYVGSLLLVLSAIGGYCWRREFLIIVRQRSAMTIWHVDDAGCGRGSEWAAERSDRQG